MTRMFATKHDLPLQSRQALVEILNGRLADAIDLAAQAKQAHWNVKGPGFKGLHDLFDAVHDEARAHVDAIAERVTALGGLAEGTLAIAVERSSLPKYPAEIVDQGAHLEAMSTALAAFGAGVRRGIGQAEDLGDADTADLFTQISSATDKTLWMVEAHTQASE